MLDLNQINILLKLSIREARETCRNKTLRINQLNNITIALQGMKNNIIKEERD